MKKEVVEYLARYLECQQVKSEHPHSARLLHPLLIPEWKSETISIDLIRRLPKSKKKNDSIMVVVDKMRKSTHFVLVQSTFKAFQIANIFMQNIFRLHGIPRVIIFDRDIKITSSFWKALLECLGTQLHFITTYHPSKDGKTERVNKIIEDMLQTYVMQ